MHSCTRANGVVVRLSYIVMEHISNHMHSKFKCCFIAQYIDEESCISAGCVATYLSLISPLITYNISCSIEELSVEPSDMTDMKEDLLISL